MNHNSRYVLHWDRKVKMNVKSQREIFHLVLINPSHYDQDGYVIQWAWSSIPSNSLAALYGLAMDCAERFVLGNHVDIVITAIDETNTRLKISSLIHKIQNSGGGALIGLVGVQSNQFPRAMDIARQFRAMNIKVCIGGFHVSGSLAMLPKIPPELQEALDLGITLFAGEAEGRLTSLLQEAYGNKMKPLYNYLDSLPNLQGAPGPFLPATVIKRTAGARTSYDAGRGCPFLCSFCTIINVQGRKSRHRSIDDVEWIVRANFAQGIKSFFITDDNFARNRVWQDLLDRLIHLREKEKIGLDIIIQVDTMCHKLPNFIEKCRRAGVDRVFIGLENINAESLLMVRKGQNRISEYRKMLQAWQNAGITTYAGYILGFPSDTSQSIMADIKVIQRELPIDFLEFFILTPLPGSAQHKELYQQEVAMDPDLNNYDMAHVTTHHPNMSREELYENYRRAWDLYYSPEHLETLVRRAKARGTTSNQMISKLVAFCGIPKSEKLHPLEIGYFRRKYRKDRRTNMPRENFFVFYPRYGWEILYKCFNFLVLNWQYRGICRLVEKDPIPYTDFALSLRESE